MGHIQNSRFCDHDGGNLVTNGVTVLIVLSEETMSYNLD